MRLDPEHVRKLESALERDEHGEVVVKIDLEFLNTSLRRLSLWEGGLVWTAVMRAAQAKKRTDDQRALLALFVHPGAAKVTEADHG